MSKPPITTVTVARLRVGLGVAMASPDRQPTLNAPIMPNWLARLMVLLVVVGALALVAWWHGYP